MPQVSIAQRRGVGAPEVIVPGQCLEHSQMRSARLMEACEQAIDNAQSALRCDDQLCPTLAGVYNTLGVIAVGTTVVPTAMTRRPSTWAALMRLAVSGARRYSSA